MRFPEALRQPEPTVSFEALRKNPEAFEGRTVILGGDIIKTENMEAQTSIEILQKPLDRFEAPLITDRTAGRFMAKCDVYLDPAIYDRGRQVTIAGKVLGGFAGQVGEADYLYPTISCIEMRLWPQPSPDIAYFTSPVVFIFRPWRIPTITIGRGMVDRGVIASGRPLPTSLAARRCNRPRRLLWWHLQFRYG